MATLATALRSSVQLDALQFMRVSLEVGSQADKMAQTVNKATTAVGTGFSTADRAMLKAAQSSEALTTKIGLQTRQMGILKQELDATVAKENASSLASQKKALAVDKLSASITQNEGKLHAVQQALDAEASAAHQAATATTALETSADHASTGLSKMEQIGVGALRQVGALAVSAGLAGARELENLGKTTISVAADFQAGMNQFEIAVGKTIDGSGKSLGDFRQLFIQLGKDLPVSTSAVEAAATEMARGGIDPATIAADGLRRTIQFAAASLKGDLSQAATISAKTMQAWTSVTDTAATKTAFLAHAQDEMTQATTAASTTADQLFLGLSNVGGSARLAGLSFDETVTALAQLTPSFSSSADAGTSFKVFLQSLLPTGKAQIEQMQALGLYTADTGSKFYDATGKFIGMQKAEELLHAATMNLTDAQREQALKILFGTDAIRAAAVIATQGAAGYDGLAQSISKQSNVAQAAAITQRGLNTAWENAKGSVEAFEITVGSKAVPALTDLLNKGITPGINRMTDFADAVLSANDPMQALETRVNNIIPGFRGTVTVLGDVKAGVVAVGGATAAYTLTQLPTLIPMLYKEAAAWGASLGPLALVAAGIYAAVRAQDAYLAQARLIVERQDKTNESMQAGRLALADYTTNLAGQGAGVDELGGHLSDLIQKHDDIATSLQRWDTASASTRGFMHLTNAEIDAMRQQVKDLNPQIQDVASHLEMMAGAARQLEIDKITPPKGVWSVYSGEIQGATVAVSALNAVILPTGQDLNDLNKSLEKAGKEGLSAFSDILNTAATSTGGIADLTTQHWAKVADIDAGLRGKITDARRGALETDRANELKSYSEALSNQLVAEGQQLAAEKQHLGQMLIEEITAQAQINGVAPARTAEMVNKVAAAYGVLPDLATTAFGSMTGSILDWAKNANISADDVIGSMTKTSDTTIATREEMEKLAKKYEAQLIQNFMDGKISADAFLAAEQQIPARVYSEIQTNAAAAALAIQAIKVALDSIDKNPIIHVHVASDSTPTVPRAAPPAAGRGGSIGGGRNSKSIGDMTSKSFGAVDVWGTQALAVPHSIDTFADDADRILAKLNAVGKKYNADKFKGVFDMLAGLRNVVDGVESLSDFKAPPTANIDAFATGTDYLTRKISAIAAHYKAKVLEQTGVYADATSKVGSMVSSVASGLTAIQNYQGVIPASMDWFDSDLRLLTKKMIATGQSFDADAIAATAVFAEAEAKIVAPVSQSVAAIGSLRTYQGIIPNLLDWYGADLTLLTNKLIDVSNHVDADALKLGAVFGDNVGKLTAPVKNTVDGIAALRVYQGLLPNLLDWFGADLILLTDKLNDVASKVDTKAAAAAAAYQTNVAAIVAPIKATIDAITATHDYQGLLPASLDWLGGDIDLLVKKMIEITGHVNKDAVKAAADFATSEGLIVAPIIATIAAFNGINKYKGVMPAAVMLLLNDTSAVVQTIVIMDALLSGDGLKAAVDVATQEQAIFSSLSAGLSFFTQVSGYKGDATKHVQKLVDDMVEVNKMTGVMSYQAGAAASGALDWQNHLEAYAARIRAGFDAIAGLNGLTATATIHAQTRIVQDSGSGTQGLPSSPFGGYTPRATGGPVTAGMPYVVGDGGHPELFVPDQNGYIQSQVPTGGGDVVHINIDARGATMNERQFRQVVEDALDERDRRFGQRSKGR